MLIEWIYARFWDRFPRCCCVLSLEQLTGLLLKTQTYLYGAAQTKLCRSEEYTCKCSLFSFRSEVLFLFLPIIP